MNLCPSIKLQGIIQLFVVNATTLLCLRHKYFYRCTSQTYYRSFTTFCHIYCTHSLSVSLCLCLCLCLSLSLSLSASLNLSLCLSLSLRLSLPLSLPLSISLNLSKSFLPNHIRSYSTLLYSILYRLPLYRAKRWRCYVTSARDCWVLRERCSPNNLMMSRAKPRGGRRR
jgi:hypothetical protein